MHSEFMDVHNENSVDQYALIYKYNLKHESFEKSEQNQL